MFLSKEHNLLGAIDNRPSENETDVVQDGYELQYDYPEERMMLLDSEMIVALKLGLDEYSNVVQMQFVIA